MKKQPTEFFKSFLVWLTLIVFFAGIPMIVLLGAGNEYFNLQKSKDEARLKSYVQIVATKVRQCPQGDSFWATYFSKNILPDKKNNASKDVKIWLKESRAEKKNQFDYILWDTSGDIVGNTFGSRISSKVCRELLMMILNYAVHWKEYENFRSIRLWKVNLNILRQFLGKYFDIKFSFDKFYPTKNVLIYPGITKSRPPFWFCLTEKYVVLIFIDNKSFRFKPGLYHYMKKEAIAKNVEAGLYMPFSKPAILSSFPESKRFQKLFKNMDEQMVSFHEAENSYIFLNYINPEVSIFIVVKKYYNSALFYKYVIAAFIIFTILAFPLYKYSYRALVLGIHGALSIRWKLAFLFFFASGLPIIVMLTFSQSYYKEKRIETVRKIRGKAVTMLNNFDNKLLSVYAKYEEKGNELQKKLSKQLSKNRLNKKQWRKLLNEAIKMHVAHFYIVFSHYECLITEDGIDYSNFTKKLDSLAAKKKMPSYEKNRILTSAVAKSLMNNMNGEVTSNRLMQKVGMFAESFLQKSITEISYTFVSAMDNISKWGLQNIKNLTLIKFISLPRKEQIECILLLIWLSRDLQNEVINSSLLAVNRNSLHLRILVKTPSSKTVLPSNFALSASLTKFFNEIGRNANEEFQTVSFHGKKYLCVGIKGKKLSDYQLAALYPIEEVDNTIAKKQSDLILLVVFSITLAAGLVQMLYKSFNIPLQNIEKAALAIEKRNFSLQIDSVSKDELGEIVNIFNEAMVGLEELQIAKIVQDSIFPTSELIDGNFSTFGQVVSNSNLGGSHFDYFQIDENHFGIFAAKILEKGVSAALLMGIVKTGLLCSKDLHLKPADLINKIINLISNTRKKENVDDLIKFQYLCVNNLTGEIFYSNHEAEPPIIVSKELSSCNLIEQSEANLKVGDALVIYTDKRFRSAEALSKYISVDYDESAKNYCDNILSNSVEQKEGACVVVSVFRPDKLC